ncbi:hypothetical protein HNR19_004384 [Nocardioides thalensis]|uniref:Uncharacterized protein n=1 Tax=Nocardioides thalensis TaxID=1914755 RepID=A0A853C9J3_9ACTN|nr:hypothetical protein [Nocardioides thalensis]NYJ03686.1 hypothetical protein [Nocardioides thalensis]
MSPVSRVLAAIGGALALVTWLLYLSVIDAQGGGDAARVVFWSVAMLAVPALAAVSLVVSRRAASIVLALATAPAAGLGLLAIFSVGPGFLAAAAALAAACVCALAATGARPAQVL